jgi:hypothetical protein
VNDYGAMVRQLMGLVQPVGDVIPFGKRNLYPNPMSEGGKPTQGGSGEAYRRATDMQRIDRRSAADKMYDKATMLRFQQNLEREKLGLPPLPPVPED